MDEYRANIRSEMRIYDRTISKEDMGNKEGWDAALTIGLIAVLDNLPAAGKIILLAPGWGVPIVDVGMKVATGGMLEIQCANIACSVEDLPFLLRTAAKEWLIMTQLYHYRDDAMRLRVDRIVRDSGYTLQDVGQYEGERTAVYVPMETKFQKSIERGN